MTEWTGRVNHRGVTGECGVEPRPVVEPRYPVLEPQLARDSPHLTTVAASQGRMKPTISCLPGDELPGVAVGAVQQEAHAIGRET